MVTQFAKTLSIKFAHNLMVVAVLIAVGFVGMMTQEVIQHDDKPVNMSEGRSLLADDEYSSKCWTASQKPKADLPGSAIIEYNNGRAYFVTDHKRVDMAFSDSLGLRTTEKFDVVALCL